MISASELAAMQAAQNAIFDLSCQIQRKTNTADGYGGVTEAWATIATVNVGMAQPNAGQLTNYAYVIGSLPAWQVHLPYGTSVQAQDHLIISSQTLEVQVVLNLRSNPTMVTVLASEVK